MSLVLTWDNHNRLAQADQQVAYDDGDTGLETGQQTVVEFRFGTASSGPWGEPTTRIVTTPSIAEYDPPADGWVQITVYSIRDGVTSWQAHVGVMAVVGGVPVEPLPYVDELDDPYTDETADPYEGI
ncbi:MAG TPA: hypothetical protein VLC71_05855 [Thermomonas sp.]|nr:hypothetical protein [Thermomonas sp.]